MRILDWNQLDENARNVALARPGAAERADIVAQTRAVLDAARAGDAAAIRALTLRFDAADVANPRVSTLELQAARSALAPEDIAALERAAANVRRFHAAQQPPPLSLETEPGVRCERILRAIQSVGLYVPAGTAPLPSAVIMLAIPASIAGCATRVLCTPPRKDGSAHPAILVAAQICGVTEIFKIGGAQAIAAMAYGLAGLPKCDKLFGPGNAWVTAAKQLVAADPAGAALDMPAGPSEVLVIADASARADFVAADLLAQAEHDPLSQAILITTDRQLAEAVAAELQAQRSALSRRSVLEVSIASSRILVVPDLETALQLSNRYAPEHLILEVSEPRRWLERVSNAGSVFLGSWTPEPLGDYCSGTNHVLPTYGYARAYSGLSLLDFTKRITVQELTAAGLHSLGPTAERLARLEGLDAHAAAVRLRLDALTRGAA